MYLLHTKDTLRNTVILPACNLVVAMPEVLLGLCKMHCDINI